MRSSVGFVSISMLCAASLTAQAEALRPVTEADYAPVNLQEALLGQQLFYDPILSGNRTVSCATCHHPDFATSDGVSLSLGDGGIGLGPERRPDPDNPPEQHIPRNAPALFNLGATEFTALFHDGRIAVDPDRPGGLRTPLDDEMVVGFANLLSAQTMFPVLSQDEMAGHYTENEIARAVRQGLITGPDGAWALISDRVAQIPAYAEAFTAVYPHITEPDQIAFTDISNAIAAFVAHEWRSDTSPFDAYLRGGPALPAEAEAGRVLFYETLGCAGCHAGPFQTDHGFHAMGDVQIGPGKAARFESHARDEGRFRVTGHTDDLYAFRTPSLRNIAETAPYGHAGAYAELADYLRAHADPAAAWAGYGHAAARVAPLEADTWRVLDDPAERAAILATVTGPGVTLSDAEVAALIAFLEQLTDPVALTGRLGIPAAVPSGLPVVGR
ncbi:cytochrome-c peroxidase [Flavimaricola marinus]|uniref:Cytochrome c551 peroxidase n=1 Tax=Flavimaricola marinus TaxID=1819565 RepID=A0A238LJT1_9RHOB|nr:cytochrome c peroxidase [Flavimaricola marinus]SMY09140.1 Cytochrome c551 peroxidase precursor [Flavimaricola marinus]